MLIQSSVRAIIVGFFAMSCLIARPLSAQTGTEPRTETVKPSTVAPVDASPTPTPTTADINDDIWNLLNSVSNRVDTTIDRATQARDRATEARDSAGEMVDNMHDGLGNLTTEMRERIEDAVQELQQAVLDELAGATDFTNGPNSCSPECEAFRDDLVALLTSVQDIANALLAEAGVPGQADLSAEIALIESLGGKALYPLYRVLGTLPVLEDDFLASIGQVAGNLAEVAPYIGDAVVAGGTVDVCMLLADNDKLLTRIITVAGNIDKVGKGSKMAGAVLSAVGKRKINGRVGVWGWAGVSYTGGLLERFGKHLESLGGYLTPIADKVEKKLQYCVLKVNGEIIIEKVDTNHDQVTQSQQAILDAVKALKAAKANGADLNGNGIVDLADYALFQNRFGSTGN